MEERRKRRKMEKQVGDTEDSLTSSSLLDEKIIPVEGDNNCAFYAFGIGLMENIYNQTLALNPQTHATFLRIFGHNLFRQAEDATVEQVTGWVEKHYFERHSQKIYGQLNPVLRSLTNRLVKERWSDVVGKMLVELNGMVDGAQATEENIFCWDTFNEMFAESSLRDGEFGDNLRNFIDEISHSEEPRIGSANWRMKVRGWLNDPSNQALYLTGVLNELWASQEIELPFLGKYFTVTIYVDDALIHKENTKAEIGLIMPKGTHYNYKRRITDAGFPESEESKSSGSEFYGEESEESSEELSSSGPEKSFGDSDEDASGQSEEIELSEKAPPSKRRRIRRIICVDSEDGELVESKHSSSQHTPESILPQKENRKSRGERLLEAALKKQIAVRKIKPTEKHQSFYHAALGKHVPEKGTVFFDAVSAEKIRFGQAIKDAKEDTKKIRVKKTSSLMGLRAEAIKALVMDGCYGGGLYLQSVRKKYLEFLEENIEKALELWLKFEHYLRQYPTIVDYIYRSTGELGQASLQDKFIDTLKSNRGMLYALMKSEKFLQRQFLNYRNKLNQKFNWKKIVSDEMAIRELGDYLQDRALILSPVEIHMFALIFYKDIALYVANYQGKLIFVERFNSGSSGHLCEIQLNENNNYEVLEKSQVLSFSNIIRGKKIPRKEIEDKTDSKSIIERLKAMFSVLDIRPVSEQDLVDSALTCIKSPSTCVEDRLEIANLLKTMGYLVHGNLNPLDKEFKPEKISIFNFEKPFMELRSTLWEMISDEKNTQHAAFEKRNKLIANIAFNLTYFHQGLKKRAVVYLPICIPGCSVHSDDGNHSERSLYETLLKSTVIEDMLKALPKKLAETTRNEVSELTIYKINAAVIQILSRFRSCDKCHEEGLKFLNGNALLRSIQEKIRAEEWLIPSKTHKGLAAAIQFDFNFSPTTLEAKNSYTKPLYYADQKKERGNFSSSGVFIQRQTRKIGDGSMQVEPYTLFLSHGKYSWVGNPFPKSTRMENIKKNILHLSVEQEDLEEALKEWEYTGVYTDLGGPGQCGFCDHSPIRYEFDIMNMYNGNFLSTGSKCIIQFDGVRFLDEDDLLIFDREEREDKLKLDKKSGKLSINLDEVLRLLSAAVVPKENFLKIYQENGYFTPNQAVKVVEIMKKKSVKKELAKQKISARSFKPKIFYESTDELNHFSNAQLKSIKKCLNSSQKADFEKIEAQRGGPKKQGIVEKSSAKQKKLIASLQKFTSPSHDACRESSPPKVLPSQLLPHTASYSLVSPPTQSSSSSAENRQSPASVNSSISSFEISRVPSTTKQLSPAKVSLSQSLSYPASNSLVLSLVQSSSGSSENRQTPASVNSPAHSLQASRVPITVRDDQRKEQLSEEKLILGFLKKIDSYLNSPNKRYQPLHKYYQNKKYLTEKQIDLVKNLCSRHRLDDSLIEHIKKESGQQKVASFSCASYAQPSLMASRVASSQSLPPSALRSWMPFFAQSSSSSSENRQTSQNPAASSFFQPILAQKPESVNISAAKPGFFGSSSRSAAAQEVALARPIVEADSLSHHAIDSLINALYPESDQNTRNLTERAYYLEKLNAIQIIDVAKSKALLEELMQEKKSRVKISASFKM